MAQAEREQFWMVYGKDQRAPTVRHMTRWQAQQEAQRLAKNNPGIEFYVLAAVDGFVTHEPVERIKIIEELPF